MYRRQKFGIVTLSQQKDESKDLCLIKFGVLCYKNTQKQMHSQTRWFSTLLISFL